MAPSFHLHDFGRTVGRLFRWIRTLSFLFIGVMIVLLGFRVAEVYRALRDLNPWLGWAFLLALGLALYLLVARPLVRLLRMPVVMKPPRLPEASERGPRHLLAHLEFVDRYVAALRSNPEWDGDPAQVQAVRATCRSLMARTERASRSDLPALVAELGTLERDAVGRLLAPLDRKAADAIRAEALKVGLATAVSPYGTLDAFLVLWRNVNLVTRVATIYYGRPGARGTLKILRDVAMATMLGAYLEELGQIAGEAVGSLVGKTAGFFTGPLMEGCLNGVATLRIGYVAKRRCRAFTAWTPKTAPQAARDAVAEAGHLSAGLVRDVVTSVGGGLLSLTGTALTKLVEKASALFRSTRPGEEPAGA